MACRWYLAQLPDPLLTFELYAFNLHSFGLNIYGLCSYDPSSHGSNSYGRTGMVLGVGMAERRVHVKRVHRCAVLALYSYGYIVMA